MKVEDLKSCETTKTLKVGELIRILSEYPSDTDVFVGCQGYSNFDFSNNEPWADSETQVEEMEGRLFITDCCELGM